VMASEFDALVLRCRDIYQRLSPAHRRQLVSSLRAIATAFEDYGIVRSEGPTTPEDALRSAGISSKRQAKYQRRMSRLLAGR